MGHPPVHELFSRVAARQGGRPAVVRGGAAVSYGQLEAASNRLAGRLLDSGLGRGEVVAVIAAEPAQVVAGILAVLKAGGVYMPLDPGSPRGRLRGMAGRVAPARALVGDGSAALAVDVLGEGIERVPLSDPGAAGGVETAPMVPRDPDDPCSIYFTSGSTGRPKAILGRLKGIDHFVRWEAELLGVTVGTRVSQLASPAFDGFLKDVFTPLVAGGVACAPESRDLLLDASRLVDWIDAEGIEVLHCVPSVLRAIIGQPLDPRYFAELRWVVLAGEAVHRSDVSRWREVFGDRIGLVNLYGPTETTVTKLFHIVVAEDLERPSIPIGKPMPGAAALVVDGRDRPCGVGDVGEIVLRTPYRAHGYYDDPETTRAAFVLNPFADDPDDDDLVYRTGDLGRLLPDGCFEFLGRRDQQVKVRGVRVELGEIEGLLVAHPAVGEAVVVDRLDGEGNTILCAYFVPASGRGGDTDELRRHLGELLPEAMVPSAWFEMRELPRTLSGKIDRRSLPSLDQVQAARASGVAESSRSPLEEILAGIFAEVLRLPRIGRDDDFFRLGGHSLLATQVVLRVRQALRLELSLRTLFAAPTVRRLAAELARLRRSGEAPELVAIRPVPRNGHMPLSYAQQRMWLLESLSAGSAAFNLPMAMRLRGRLDLAAFARTFAEVVRRHEVLRTTFPLGDGMPVQVIGPPRPPPLPVCDLAALPPERRESEARRLVARDARQPFDLAAGPLLRLRVLRLAGDEHVVACTLHHLAGDAWSFGVLTSEIGRLYDSFRRGERSPLPELPVQYADFAVWQREWLTGAVLERRLDYWRRQLAGAPERLALPQSRSRRALQSFGGRRAPMVIEPELAAAVRALGRREGATLFMSMLTGFLVLLSRYTGQRDLLVGSVFANRDLPETAELIGFLADTVVLRVDLTGELSYLDLLGRVREVCVDAHAHQLPTEKLVESFAHPPGLGDRLFDVWFQVESGARDALRLADLEGEPLPVDRKSTRFELSLVLEDEGERIRGEIEYDAHLFDDATIAEMRDELTAVLSEMTSGPEEMF